MTQYEVLLQRPEWKEKRKEILKRDKSLCSHCTNKKLYAAAQLGVILRVQRVPNSYIGHVKLLRTDASVTFYYSKLNPLVNYRHSTVLLSTKVDALNVTHYNLVALNQSDGEYFEVMMSYLQDGFDSNNYKIALERFETKLFTRPWKFVSGSGLHVHHEYYQCNLDPWEYPNEALTTLCWVCHAETHQNSTVPHLDANGKEIGRMTCCSRCNGAGSFPDYSHVDSGICFRCGGAKYEELI